ncbi:MAG: HAMP domain-containing sensor histidine kinase [Clostridia bacterium]|nr:HAMP domain-containing sensor histidine kinase [Clostridia bacterium]
MGKAVIFLLAAIAAASLLTAVLSWRKTRRTMENLNRMLDAAMDGTFAEAHFDESLFSAVEHRLSRYLSASAVSARNLAAEKDKIKELIADISHQTKTPIANILLYAQLLGEQPLPEESRASVTALNAQAEKLRFLIDALVKTSRLETGVLALRPRHAAVQPVLEEALSQIAPKAAAKGIAVSLLPTDAAACFDPKWTAEAIYNIVDNAVKYTPPGGAVRMRVLPYALFVRIDIADTGIGIDEAEQARIFSRFYRSPAACDVEGLGIGLYLSRQIVAGEGGYIKVSSSGQGSIFSVFLPQETGNLTKPSE